MAAAAPGYHGGMEIPALAVPCADELAQCLRASGFAFVAGERMHARLREATSLDDWDAFAASWNDLPLDRYMADRGRYRRRRHACYRLAADGGLQRLPHRAHFQTVDYNPLNGGVERWFEPVRDDLGEGATLRAILATCHAVFGAVEPAPAGGWSVEVHQQDQHVVHAIAVHAFRRRRAYPASRRRKACTAMAWTTCWSCWCAGATCAKARP